MEVLIGYERRCAAVNQGMHRPDAPLGWEEGARLPIIPFGGDV